MLNAEHRCLGWRRRTGRLTMRNPDLPEDGKADYSNQKDCCHPQNAGARAEAAIGAAIEPRKEQYAETNDRRRDDRREELGADA